MTQLSRSGDAGQDGLVVQDLADRHGGGSAVLVGIQERADLQIENIGSGFDDGNAGFGLQTANLMIQGHRTANGAVPALGGGDTQTAFSTHDDGITGGIQVHCPGNAEVNHNVTFQTDETGCEVIDLKLLGIFLNTALHIVTVVGVGAEECGLITGNGQRLGIADGIENHVQGIAADVAQGAQTCGSILNEGGAIGGRDASSAAAAGLDVVNLTQNAGIDDPFLLVDLKLIDQLYFAIYFSDLIHLIQCLQF